VLSPTSRLRIARNAGTGSAAENCWPFRAPRVSARAAVDANRSIGGFRAESPQRELAAALQRFGLYMQYMDDLEDYYEDRYEGRQSPIPNPWRGALRATRLLANACPELRPYYESKSPRAYRTVLTWGADLPRDHPCLVRNPRTHPPPPVRSTTASGPSHRTTGQTAPVLLRGPGGNELSAGVVAKHVE
jgi:hypothetical protein